MSPDPLQLDPSQLDPSHFNSSHLPESAEATSETVPASQHPEAGEKSSVSNAAAEADPSAKPASEEDTLIVMDSDSDDLDDETAATLNNLTLHSLQRRVQSGSPSAAPTHLRNCLSEDYSRAPAPQSPLEASFSYCSLLQLIHESDVGLSPVSHPQDATRLQLVLILLSSFHQSVYSGITAYAQSQVLQNKTDAKISGYFLCNQQYALPVLQALCEVLRGPHLRPVTTQCSLYVMRYLLTNHVYGDMLPLSVFQDLADV